MRRDIEDVVETLRNAKKHSIKCNVLIGAGCSVQAGIPTAQGFVEKIRTDFPRAFQRATEKTYAKCMAELSIGEQRALIKVIMHLTKYQIRDTLKPKLR